MDDILRLYELWKDGYLDGQDGNPKTAREKADMGSAGVDTHAGRNEWLASVPEGVSDLWAKYVLTGKIAYDPEATLGGIKWWGEPEEELRNHIADRLAVQFPILLEKAKGKVLEVVP